MKLAKKGLLILIQVSPNHVGGFFFTTFEGPCGAGGGKSKARHCDNQKELEDVLCIHAVGDLMVFSSPVGVIGT
jgi:hypothetical protein